MKDCIAFLMQRGKGEPKAFKTSLGPNLNKDTFTKAFEVKCCRKYFIRGGLTRQDVGKRIM